LAGGLDFDLIDGALHRMDSFLSIHII